ncbi:MAG: hypothetical protein MI784_10475 [Cytophagales bacterium]|nr:hypothetical protein [Cytophagales bacterium]
MKTKLTALFICIMLYVRNLPAQCAMCRASVESNVSQGDSESFAAGLNMGILYLFVMPYVVILLIIYFWRKNAKKNLKNDYN